MTNSNVGLVDPQQNHHQICIISFTFISTWFLDALASLAFKLSQSVSVILFQILYSLYSQYSLFNFYTVNTSNNVNKVNTVNKVNSVNKLDIINTIDTVNTFNQVIQPLQVNLAHLRVDFEQFFYLKQD